jgi:ABC-2 type transport system ATP-binding protein
MQQRIGLAQALIHEPELVFLDEPTDGVDPIGRADIREIVLELRRAGCTVFINSHLLMEVELVCDRVVIMDRGRILRSGAVDELTRATGRVRFAIEPVPAELPRLLDGLGERLEVDERGFELNVRNGELDRTIDRLRAAGVSIRALEPHRLTLEQAFLALVQERRA